MSDAEAIRDYWESEWNALPEPERQTIVRAVRTLPLFTDRDENGYTFRVRCQIELAFRRGQRLVDVPSKRRKREQGLQLFAE